MRLHSSDLILLDLSICPLNVSANTYATALAVGEKAASIIARDLKIPYSVRPNAEVPVETLQAIDLDARL